MAILWHNLTPADTAVALRSHATDGLASAEAESRLRANGPNAITRRPGPPAWKLLLGQLTQPLVLILVAAGLLTAGLGDHIDAAIIFVVVAVNAVIGFVQEWKAGQAIDRLADAMTAEATVIRSGRRSRVDAQTLVVGDLVALQPGDRVPADLRIVTARELRIGEAALTGESLPVSKRPDAVSAEIGLADRTGIAHASSLVASGGGMGLVVETGDRTEVGRIATMVAEAEEQATPLTREIGRFSQWLLWLIVGLAVAVVVLGLMRGEPLVELVKAAVALAVGAIPEGLPAAVTIVLAVGVWRMARRGAILRQLPAVETLGSTTVICTDKTGTLTENAMTVQRIVAGAGRYHLTGTGYAPTGAVIADVADEPALLAIMTASVLCNDSALIHRDDRWQIHGDPTEGALLVAARKGGLNPDDLRHASPRLDAVPFESERQYMATLHAGAIHVKGSVETVLARCEDVDASAIHAEVAALAADGLRVLAIASKPFTAETLADADLAAGFTFLGLQAMIDPPRPEAVAAVAACRSAGITVKMLTGDHAGTASAIGRAVGLASDGPDGQPRVLTGQQLAALDDAALESAALGTNVFARMSPEQKLRLVKAMQRQGHIVAMTGDGVNDAPALKQSDIGVAMGIAGTDAAKDAAAMVLTDDNFATIEAAVEEGRAVFDNLAKFLVWNLPTNIALGLLVLVAEVWRLDLPISPAQILWINLTTAGLLGLTLTFEPREAGLMRRPPRDPRKRILTTPLLRRMLLVSAVLVGGSFFLFSYELSQNRSHAEAQTVAVNVFVLVEAAFLVQCRSLTLPFWRLAPNPILWVGMGIMAVLQILFTYAPFMQTAFRVAPVDATTWLHAGVVAALGGLIVAADKWWAGQSPHQHSADAFAQPR